MNLSTMYYNGDGVVDDYVLSLMWRYVSYLNGNKDAMRMTEAHKYIRNQMSNRQIKTAEKLAKQCFESRYTQCEE